MNYTKQLRYLGNKTPYSLKTAITYNDSIILAGYSNGLLKLNSITQTITNLSTVTKRVTALVKANDGMVYFGSIDGLYKYNYLKNTFLSLSPKNHLLGERVMALCSTPDNLLWIATSNNGIVVVKDDKVLLNITTRGGCSM